MKLSQRAEDMAEALKIGSGSFQHNLDRVGECLHPVDMYINQKPSEFMGLLDDFPVDKWRSFPKSCSLCQLLRSNTEVKDIESKCCWGESCCCRHVNLLTSRDGDVSEAYGIHYDMVGSQLYK